MPSIEDGRRLYLRHHPRRGETNEFDAMTDTPINRGRLRAITGKGGARGRAAHAKLTEWDAAKAEEGKAEGTTRTEPLGEVTGGTTGTDPFGPPAA